MKIFITGARGPIGRNLSSILEGYETVCFSRNADAKHLPMSQIALELVRRKPEAILHLAWSTLPATAEAHPGAEWIADLPLLSELCASIARSPAIERQQLIFLSTGAVYGESSSIPHDENSQAAPKGWYARGKLAAEQLIGNFAQAENLRALILRVSTVYGFRQEAARMQGIIPKLIDAANSGDPCPIWGDGSTRKDFLHILDLAEAIKQSLNHRLLGVYNICTGVSTSISQVADEVRGATGRELVLKYHDSSPWDVVSTHLCFSKFHADVGWVPKISLVDGIRRMVRDCRLSSPPS
jgi:UDP-glucose 4-epimerase